MLESFVTAQIFAFMLIFIRIGSGVMVMPGVGESYVSPRIRLLFALSLSLALTPALTDYIPAVPLSPLTLAALVATEMIIGLFFGFLARIIVSAMHTVGMVVSYQSSLSAATMFDISQAGQGSTLGNFLSITTVLLLFVTDMHHLMLQGLVDSYRLFTPGDTLPANDIADSMARLISDVFNIAIKLSSPIIVVGLMLYMAAGLLARLMPNMQVFFVIIPPQIQICLFVLMTSLSGVFLWYLEFVEAQLNVFVAG